MFAEGEGSADFSGISDGKKSPGLHVSKVIQKTIFEVDEEGGETEDAKGSKAGEKKKGSSSSSSSGPIITIAFLVDRPFYFQVVDHVNGDLVIVSGHVNDPSDSP